jgi:hypothetical protein
MAGTGRRPVAGHPFVPVAHPPPISPQPNVAGLWGDADDFLSRWGRRDQHHSIGVMPLVGHNDAGAKCDGEDAQTSVTEYVGAHAGNLLFLDPRVQE